MFKILEFYKENIKKGINNYDISNDIYAILLKTGKYVNAKDKICLIIKKSFI